MPVSQELHERIKAFATEPRQEIHGVSGTPQRGTKFTKIMVAMPPLLAGRKVSTGPLQAGLDVSVLLGDLLVRG